MGRRTTKLAIVIVILSFVLSTFVSLWSLHLMAQRNVQELSKSLAARIYDSIRSEMSEPVNVSRSMAHDSFLIDALKREDRTGQEQMEQLMADYLTGQKEAFGYEAAFVVSDASKLYYSYAGLNKKIEEAGADRDLWYARFVASGEDYDLDVDRDELGGDQWTIFVDTRIEDQDAQLIGVCGVGARMTGSQDLFVSLEQEYGVRISLIDSDGLIQVDTDESRIRKEYLNDLQLSQKNEYLYQKHDADRCVVTKYIDDLDWYLVVESNAGEERRQLLNLLMMNIVMCVGVLVIMLLALRIIISRTRALSDASFVDQSTQLMNRRSFEEKKAILASAQLTGDFTYFTADLNGLKRVNDTMGHAAGDELIKAAASCLKACLGAYGRIYRIGGDEFVGLLNLTSGQMDSAIARLDEMTASWEGQQIKGFTISCGWATSREFPSENISELARISDERMYEAKEAYYQKTGLRR